MRVEKIHTSTASDVYLYILSLLLTTLISSPIEPQSFVHIESPLSISTQKSYPPYLAHLQMTSLSQDDQSTQIDNEVQLSTETLFAEIEKHTHTPSLSLDGSSKLLSQDIHPMQLDEIKFTKQELIQLEASGNFENKAAGRDQELEPLLEENENYNREKAKDPSQFAYQAEDHVFNQAGNQKLNQSEDQELMLGAFGDEHLMSSLNSQQRARLEVAAKNSTLWAKELPVLNKRESIERGTFMEGALEFREGLAITHEDRILIQKVEEGISTALGSVDLKKGIYSIQVDDLNGKIVAQLIEKTGNVLGSGSIDLTKIKSPMTKKINGPKLVLKPIRGLEGTYRSAYAPEGRANKVFPQGEVAVFNGTEVIKNAEPGTISDERFGTSSETIMVIHAKGYAPTLYTATAGTEVDLKLLPEKMVKGLKEIVSDQRQQDYNDPNASIVWGRIMLDNMPISGVSVQSEVSNETETIYFNELMLPDPMLNSTSTNGYFAIIGLESGMHSLRAQRGDRFFSHGNVVTEKGFVSLVNIQSSAQSLFAKVRVYNAFNSAPLEAEVELQSYGETITTKGGSSLVSLAKNYSAGFAQVKTSEDYMPAQYHFKGEEDHIHIPLIPVSWLMQLRAGMKLYDRPYGSTLVGFVPDEDYSLEIAEMDSEFTVVYFNQAGHVVEKGVSDGGFVVFNASPGQNEVRIKTVKSNKIYSRVLPFDPNTTTVISFQNTL